MSVEPTTLPLRDVPQGRRLPQSVEAEVAVLGAMLLDPAAIGRAVEANLREDDFVPVAHRVIFRAVLRLYDRRQAVDPVTLKEELRRSGDLERAGGDPYLGEVIASVPTIANVEHHARIVLDNSTKRKLINVGTQIVADAYERPEDADVLLDQSEKRIFEIAERRLREGFVPINRLLHRTIELVESLSQNPDRVTGVPSGFKDLDNLTAGFQLSDLIIVAGRPGTGKTAFSLNVAQNASIRKDIPVAVFSLEMSKDQLVQRILSSEAGVDAQKMRTGHPSREEWQRIVRACDRLMNAKIYIDDTPGLTILEMRAKARRLKSEIDLGLVVVDYLQLMEVGTGPMRAENRQQEISIISRSIKGLAKELNIPVIALSQLSRAPEQRADHRPTLSDLRECVTGETLVVLTDGRRIPIAELVGTTPSVYAMAANGRIVRAVADRVWRVGRRPVFELRLASGRRLRATAKHRVLTREGWKRLVDLARGDRVALARRIPEPLEPIRWPEQRLILLAHLIGDGSYLSNQPMRYASASEENSLAVETAARLEFGADVKRHRGRGRWHQLLITGNGNRWHPARVNEWLRELGIFGQRSHEKRIPREVFRLENDQIATFLRHLWATDGTICLRKGGRRLQGGMDFCTCSEGLAGDVAALLLRMA
ncbi:MAG: replicative DNA helicase, partial [Gemmatimonadota bacterium]